MILKNKKGQERETTLGWIIGLVAVILIVLFIWVFYSYLNKAPEGLPEDVALRAFVCKGYANLGSDSYCTEFKELELAEGKIYTNCQYPLIEAEVKKDYPTVPVCEVNEGDAFCERKQQDPDFTKSIRVYNVSSGIFDCNPVA